MNDTDRDSLEQAIIVAHQIKSPVGTVQTILRTLLGGFAGELTVQQKKILESGNKKCAEAMETIRGLLALAEVSSHSPGDAAADIVAIIRNAHERYRSVATGKNIQLTCEANAEEAYVRTEPAALSAAVLALLDNAIKYTPEEGRVNLRADVGPVGGQVRLVVSDSGIGIPENERDSLFTPFMRASNAKRVVPIGTGLGLPFIKAVVKGAGGSIAAGRSDLGGAEFTVALPRIEQPAAEALAAKKTRHKPSLLGVVIGGVAAGPKIASKIMRLLPDAQVTVVEKGRVLSYAGCGLPYYISGMVKEQRELVSTPEGVVRGPEYFENVKNVRVMNRTEALRIDRDNHRVLVRDIISQEQTWLPYDKLAIATGATPVVPSIPGAHLGNIFTLHGLEQAEGIKSVLAEARARDVTIVGGGLIGVEMTESLVSAGCRVTLVEMLPQLLPMLDWEMADLVRRHFETKGVRVLLDTRVTGFEGDGKVSRVLTETGAFPVDVVIMGVGVRPNVKLAAEAGIELGRTGAIKVDDHLRTSDPDIYAAGDCAETVNLVTGEPCYVPLGSTANKQGRVAAINMCGGDERFPGVVGATVCKVFDCTVARAGLTESEARERGCDVVTSLTPGIDRAHFMPDAAVIVTKLVCDAETRRLLGIQVVGPGEAAKRVDIAVTAITAGMTVDQIANLDLCYAPSYANALDNIHTACNVIRNKLDGHMVGISCMDVRRKLDKGEDVVLLDVRTHGEFDETRIEGSVHIPLRALRGRLGELPRDKEILTFSHVSLSGYEAAIILKASGFKDVKVMEGGMIMWSRGELVE